MKTDRHKRSSQIPRRKRIQKSFLLGSKRKRIVKSSSRIPGLSVGEVAQTQDGPMKKVCFNIGGKWFFRMVDTDWVPPGRPHKRAKRNPKPVLDP